MKAWEGKFWLPTICFSLAHFVFVTVWAFDGPAFPHDEEFEKFYVPAYCAFAVCIVVNFVAFFVYLCADEEAIETVTFFIIVFEGGPLLLCYFVTIFYWMDYDRYTDEFIVYGHFIRYGEMAEKYPDFAHWYNKTMMLWPVCVVVWVFLQACLWCVCCLVADCAQHNRHQQAAKGYENLL